MHSTSLYGLKLSVLTGVGAKALATDQRDEIWVNMTIFQPCFKLAKLTLWRLAVFLGFVTNKLAPVVQIVDDVILWIM